MALYFQIKKIDDIESLQLFRYNGQWYQKVRGRRARRVNDNENNYLTFIDVDKYLAVSAPVSHIDETS